MFVWREKYDKAISEKLEAELISDAITDKYNDLVEKINEKGGQDFLDNAVVLEKPIVKKLIRLCHPDVNKNSQLSNEVTIFLNSIKQPR